MIVSCATAGVADAKAQIAAVDSDMTDKRFIFLAPVEPDEPRSLSQTPPLPKLLRCENNGAVR
jgi:hypothetical protein